MSTRSQGRFKPSVLGGYERGERAVSLHRFCDLAEIYGVPADRLLAEVLSLRHPEGRHEVVIDLNRLSQVPADKARAVAEFVHNVKALRGDYLTDTVTLRGGDVEALALSLRSEAEELLSSLGPAIPRPAVEP